MMTEEQQNADSRKHAIDIVKLMTMLERPFQEKVKELKNLVEGQEQLIKQLKIRELNNLFEEQERLLNKLFEKVENIEQRENNRLINRIKCFFKSRG